MNHWEADFDRDGFAVIPNLLQPGEIAALLDALVIPVDQAGVGTRSSEYGVRNLLSLVPAVAELSASDKTHNLGRLHAGQIASVQAQLVPVTCTVARGGVVLMRPLLLHASSPAENPKHRRVIHLDYAAVDLPRGLPGSRSTRGLYIFVTRCEGPALAA